MKIRLTNPSGMLKEFDWGFSWKVFFFGGFVPLFRGDIKGFLIATFLVFATFGLYWPYFAFVYNKKYVASFLEKGFYPADEASRNTLTASGLIMGIIPTNPPPTGLGNEAPRQINGKQAEIIPVQQPEGKDNPHLRYRDIFPEKCPGCGTPREEGFSFCGTCGNKLEVLKRQATCVACGNDVDDSAEKCPSCGQLFVEKPSPTEHWAHDMDASSGADITDHTKNSPACEQEFVSSSPLQEAWECKKCGRFNKQGNSFCGKCGNTFANQEKNSFKNLVELPSADVAPSIIDLPPTKKNYSLIAVLCLVGLIVLSGVVYSSTRKTPEGLLGMAKEHYQVGAYEKAVPLLLKAAKRKNIEAQNLLGLMYTTGLGVEADPKEGASWYRQSAEQGDATGEWNLGLMYHDGLGVERNFTEAIKWYESAAIKGYPNAQYSLAYMYSNGLGVALNYKEAAKWYQLAGDQGDIYAQAILWRMHGDGLLSPEIIKEASRTLGLKKEVPFEEEYSPFARHLSGSVLFQHTKIREKPNYSGRVLHTCSKDAILSISGIAGGEEDIWLETAEPVRGWVSIDEIKLKGTPLLWLNSLKKVGYSGWYNYFSALRMSALVRLSLRELPNTIDRIVQLHGRQDFKPKKYIDDLNFSSSNPAQYYKFAYDGIQFGVLSTSEEEYLADVRMTTDYYSLAGVKVNGTKQDVIDVFGVPSDSKINKDEKEVLSYAIGDTRNNWPPANGLYFKLLNNKIIEIGVGSYLGDDSSRLDGHGFD